MSSDDAPDLPDLPGLPDSPPDRRAYLEEQIQRQKRGEAIDVEWVRAELERVRRQQVAHRMATQRNLLRLTIVSAVLLLVLWIRGGGLRQPNGVVYLGLILVGVLALWAFGRRRKN
jgi:hypothetical protein